MAPADTSNQNQKIRCAAPGRVNLIGEHTDYSGGFVMPAAIDFRTIATIHPREDGRIHLSSANMTGDAWYPSNPLPTSGRKHWSDYPMGVAWSLAQENIHPGAFSLALEGDVPLGAGLSSSASIEVATAFALLEQAGAKLPLAKIALACQRAENAYVGARCGIMDQFIACAGKKDHALMLDTRSLEYRLLPIPAHVRLIICNSMVKHEHAGGQYNVRREEVEAGTRILHQPAGLRLRPCATRPWPSATDTSAGRKCPPNVFRRCRHIITENKPESSEPPPLLSALTSRPVRHADGRSAPQLPRRLRSQLQRVGYPGRNCRRSLPGCYGARMTGGGFGGCTVNLVDESKADQFRTADPRPKYQAATTGIDADIYLCRASAGASTELP